mmetsp:Transcript_90750/g.252645  ORF Transcript_90750/g.252645 Transcript_90750/m.252645 type:complete len:203 (+) Transcript_90750:81-689(+)
MRTGDVSGPSPGRSCTSKASELRQLTSRGGSRLVYSGDAARLTMRWRSSGTSRRRASTLWSMRSLMRLRERMLLMLLHAPRAWTWRATASSTAAARTTTAPRGPSCITTSRITRTRATGARRPTLSFFARFWSHPSSTRACATGRRPTSSRARLRGLDQQPSTTSRRSRRWSTRLLYVRSRRALAATSAAPRKAQAARSCGR